LVVAFFFPIAILRDTALTFAEYFSSHFKGAVGMNTVILTDQEFEYLRELLQREIPNLRDEIRHTDDHDYREFLKERELLVKALVGKIGTPGSAAAST
jgi:hypothetical protein